MPMTAISAGAVVGFSARREALISARRAASRTASHTRERLRQTSCTVMRSRRSAAAMRASSVRRRDRATAMALSGSSWREAARTREVDTVSGLVSRSLGPVAPSPSCLTMSGAAMMREAAKGELPRMRMRRLPTIPSSRRSRRNQMRSNAASESFR